MNQPINDLGNSPDLTPTCDGCARSNAEPCGDSEGFAFCAACREQPTGLLLEDHLARMKHLFGRNDLVGNVGWSDLRHACSRTGLHFFDPETMRAFRSRLIGEPRWVQLDELVDHLEGSRPGRVVAFVTSERGPFGADDDVRRYTVRYFDGRRIRAVGSFGGHTSRSQALEALAALPRP